jgi:hypothetical protein
MLKVLFDAVRRIKGRKDAPFVRPAAPVTFTGQKVFPTYDLPPEDVEFLLELGLAPEEISHPDKYLPADVMTLKPSDLLGTELSPVAQGVSSEVMALIRSEKWMRVASSNVNAWRYLERYQIIDVQFLSGAIYQYKNCTLNTAMQFSGAPSAGRFVWYVFRLNPSQYPYAKLREPNRTKKINPRTGKGYIVFGTRKRWRYRDKKTGKML